MSRTRLSPEVVAERMVELRNLRKLHIRDRKQIADLKTELAIVRSENAELKQTVATLQIQIAELQTMVFGRKERPPMGGTPIAPALFVPEKIIRARASYKRPTPPPTAITTEVAAPLPAVCTCGGSFDPKRITTHDRYVEDIPLPEITPDYQAKLVARYTIERSRCLACGKVTTGNNTDLGGARVALGPNVRLLVTHLVSVVGLSYAQVTSMLLGLYGFVVSDGEVAAILHKQHKSWTPAYNQLKSDIRASPVRHYDETPWKIQSADNAGYAWVMSAANSPKTLFHFATSRGAGHAKQLHGSNKDNTSEVHAGVHISDDYGAYRNLSGQQQLCWVHLYRTIRDLKYNTNLPEEQQSCVNDWYASFAGIYSDLRTYLSEPYDEVVRAAQAAELWQRTTELAGQLAPQKTGEPDKLRRLKAQLLRAGKDKLFVCLLKNTPCDNNRAERDLRQLVLKRKRSFGSKSEKGAQALATVLSLCTTTWRTNPSNYFAGLAALG